MPPPVKECEHRFVDKAITTKGWSQFTYVIIYCQKCGKVSHKGYV
ncbi:hypothetical protein SEA_ENCELADUS_60 [Mycobacterium phage Enceladus]|uniref:Uncharacterized protein n=2 Tax=Bronvirus TaxID=1623278 RepID=A0A514U543_9CAUD|nr:hypothetical protein KNU48_gp098 [Mycobacterium phage Silverleaf]AEZ50739.1 hypothetical protein [Mycobacterium phage Fezzik]AZS12216.1 hypothetical protein SEA_ACQUIRE49_62 [Mycobacterium phage Acquire49]QDK04066.1 hypothetical protein SEA_AVADAKEDAVRA_62 [Mycobacterium phage AvadaKedavra]QGJ93082.1 hypothetical protein SEA_ZARIA_63 [Mycobacterium phage Zaria]UEM46346.1 hypothetical protein SEA_ENCELADUS_60 [Mycobacterium phage Enceladus]WMI34656.1 hypothetical protein SEA_CALM_63 [Mycoba